MALNALLGLDKERAFPILEKMLKEEKNLKLREQALFALTQTKHPQVLPILISLAAKDPDQKIRETAIFWLGQVGNERALKFFEEVLLNRHNDHGDNRMKK